MRWQAGREIVFLTRLSIFFPFTLFFSQLLALCKLNDELKPKHTNLISFANQLKAGNSIDENHRQRMTRGRTSDMCAMVASKNFIHKLRITTVTNSFGTPGKGLIVVASTLEGKYVERYAEAQAAKQELIRVRVVKTFCESKGISFVLLYGLIRFKKIA